MPRRPKPFGVGKVRVRVAAGPRKSDGRWRWRADRPIGQGGWAGRGACRGSHRDEEEILISVLILSKRTGKARSNVMSSNYSGKSDGVTRKADRAAQRELSAEAHRLRRSRDRLLCKVSDLQLELDAMKGESAPHGWEWDWTDEKWLNNLGRYRLAVELSGCWEAQAPNGGAVAFGTADRLTGPEGAFALAEACLEPAPTGGAQ